MLAILVGVLGGVVPGVLDAACSAATCSACLSEGDACGWFSCQGAMASCALKAASGNCDKVPCGGPAPSPSPPSPRACAANISVYAPNTNIEGGDYKNLAVQGTTPDELAAACCKKCSAESESCHHWTLDLKNSYCYLKHDGTTPLPPPPSILRNRVNSICVPLYTCLRCTHLSYNVCIL